MAMEIKGKGKYIFVQAQLEKMGYPRKMLEEDKNSERFPEFGFTYRRTKYFELPKYQKFIEQREEDRLLAKR